MYLYTYMDKLKSMREQVKEELKHIYPGELPQNELRQAYWILRMHSLGKKAKGTETKSEVLKKSIESVRKDHGDFKFRYDEDYFNVGT